MKAKGWKVIALGEFVTLQRGHDLPEHKRHPGNVPILGSFGVTGFHDEAKTSGPGVTVGRSGASFGVVTYSPADFWPLNTALYVIDFHGNDERFAYYFLKGIDFAKYNSGSAQASLNRNYIHPIPVLVPPLPEQRAIAHILGMLDDKIELNRRMNETLEAMARAIFKSWFVDFDPVRAKMERRPPLGMDAETSALFPDCFQKSESGEIPGGWTHGSLGTLVYESNERIGSDSGSVVLSAVETRELVRSDIFFNKQVYSRDRSKYKAVKKWDFVYNPSRINIGSIGLHVEDILGAVSPVYVVFRANPTFVWWLRFTIEIPICKSLIEILCSGSVRQSLTFRDFASIPATIPPESLARAFNAKYEQIRSFQSALSNQSVTLVSIRDTLLPKLLSGEIRVKDAERFAERAA